VTVEHSGTSGAVHHSSSTRRHQPDFERLKDESVRLSTFHDWPEAAERIVKPRDLARAGMFYTGQTDRVQCAFCRGCLRNWVQGDNPAEEHRKNFPNCSFIRQLKDDDGTAAVMSFHGKSQHQSQLHADSRTVYSEKSDDKLEQSSGLQVCTLSHSPCCSICVRIFTKT